jgi:tetratricopeptide (TPR) repeat protein
MRAAVAEARGQLQDAAGWARLGSLYLLVHANAAAADALHNAATLEPREFRWPYLEGIALHRAGQAAAARHAWQSALTRDPNYAPLRLRLARSALEAGHTDAAQDFLADARATATGQELAGEIALARGQVKEAVTAFTRALELAPQANWLHVRLAVAYGKAGDKQKAREHLKARGTRRPEISDPVLEAVSAARPRDVASFLEEAHAALSRNHRYSALLAFQAAVRMDPRSVPALLGIAGLSLGAGRKAEALGYLQRALEIEPGSAEAHFYAGLIQESNGAAARAESHYVRALPRESARYRLARLLLRLGRAAEALPHLEVLTAEKSATAVRFYWLGLAHLAMGNCAGAAAALDAAHARDANSGEVIAARVRVHSSCAPLDGPARARLLAQAQRLYQARPDAGDAETLAMALAAAGEFDKALRYQQQALAATAPEAPQRPFLAANLARYARGETAIAPYEKDSLRLRPPADQYSSPPAP